MSDTDAIVAQSICEAIDRLVEELAADEATITAGMVLALGRRLAEQATSREGARAGLNMVAEHLEAVVEIYMGRQLGPLSLLSGPRS